MRPRCPLCRGWLDLERRYAPGHDRLVCVNCSYDQIVRTVESILDEQEAIRIGRTLQHVKPRGRPRTTTGESEGSR